jgi:hypothetical protein
MNKVFLGFALGIVLTSLAFLRFSGSANQDNTTAGAATEELVPPPLLREELDERPVGDSANTVLEGKCPFGNAA